MPKGKYKKATRKKVAGKKRKKSGNKKVKISGSRILYGARKWQYVITLVTWIILITLVM